MIFCYHNTVLLFFLLFGVVAIASIFVTRQIGRSFKQDTQTSEQILEDDSQALQLKISQLTEELAQVNEQFKKVMQERQEVEAALRYNQDQLRLITDSVPVGIAYVDTDRRYQFVNKAYETRFNLPRQEIIGKHVWDILGQEAYKHAKGVIDQVLQGEAKTIELDVMHEADNTVYFGAKLTPAFDPSKKIIGYYVIFFDISERRRLEDSLKKANDELELLATIDGLTQIANRRKFNEYLDHEWKRLARSQEMLSLILFDVDLFKPFNDRYGHQAGDECLLTLAQAAKNAINRPADLVARYGGEEFVIILPNTDQSGAIAIAERIQSAIRALEIPNEQSEVCKIISVSLGISSLIPTLDRSPDLLITLADQAMYAAKQQGRDRYSIST